MPTTVDTPILWPLAVYFGAVLAVIAGMLGFSYVLGQRHVDRATGEPYESGIVSTGSARVRFSATFYRMAILFVVIDMESVFVFAWATAVRELGWAGYAGVSFFIVMILAALVYLWRLGALDS